MLPRKRHHVVLALVVLACIALGRFVLIGREPPPVPPSATAPGFLSHLADHAPAPRDRGSAIFPGAPTFVDTGDLDAMRARRMIRALVVPSLTDFFSLEGDLRGLQVEQLDRFAAQINRGLSPRKRIRVVYVPVPFSDLLPALIEGRGDIAAAVLTVTPRREARVDFAGGMGFPIDEIVVHNRAVEGIGKLDDLAGRRVYVLRDSSHAEHLETLNVRFAERGLAPMTIVEADRHLSTEDILELVNAGIVEITVCDNYKAKLWAKVLPELRVREDLAVRSRSRAAWAVRKNNPKLRKAIQAAAREVRHGTVLGNIFIERYFGSTQWIDNPLARDDRARLAEYAELFKRYSTQYDFDWLALVAQAYQESRLDHAARSRAGAVGIMQVLPETAADPRVDIANIEVLENNIHAGAKYMALLRDQYFTGQGLAEADVLAFTWAAYNAGPRALDRMRRRAKKMGLEPNRWFRNVEFAALDMGYRETVRYVENTYKYYTAYRLARNLLGDREAARATMYRRN